MRSLANGMKKPRFVSYIFHVLAPALKRRDALVMDNLAAHHALNVQKSLQARGDDIFFLPPYLPDMNPVERLWSVLKRLFRRRFERVSQTVGRAVGGAWRSLKNLDFAPLVQSRP